MGQIVNIAGGAGFAGDHYDLGKRAADALLTVQGPRYLIFECLAERTLALAAQAEDVNSEIDAAVAFLKPCIQTCATNGIRILSNFGGTDPKAIASGIAAYVAEAGLDLKIAAITGDQQPLSETDQDEGALACNAYTGARGMVEALERGAHIVVAGRVADPALVVAPVVHELGLGWTDWQGLAVATLAGHLVECGTQVSGGYFADADKPVSGLADLGAPIAQVSRDQVQIIKPLGGGCVSTASVKEQLLYEIGDPAAYLTPDVTLDLSGVTVRETGTNNVCITGISGHPRPETLKTLTCFQSGFIGEAEVSYLGETSKARVNLAIDVVRQRLRNSAADVQLDTFVGTQNGTPAARLRLAAQHQDKATVARALREVEALYVNGPAGGGGVRKSISPLTVTRAGYIPQDAVTQHVEMI